MEKKAKYYEYATWILGIVVLVLVLLLIRQKRLDPSADTEKVKATLASCSADIASWREKYPVGTQATDTSQAELINVFIDCVGVK